jgi:flagellar hook protein FlgE
MSFTTALSGLNAAANYLSVLGNNIANANTTGFKMSRSEFVDAYARSFSGVSRNQPGSGVRVAEVAQQFNQGNLDWTGNSLDMAINGEGFFTLAANPADLNSLVYSRAGAFEVNKDGIVTNAQGQALLAYKPNGATAANGFSTGVLTTVSLNTGAGLPVSTTKVDLGVNLDANKPAITTPPAFDPNNSDTYTTQTSVSIYDSLGVSHTLTTYFVAGAAIPGPPATRNWTAHHYIDKNQVDVAPTGTALTFDSAGKLTAPANGQVTLAPWSPPNSSAGPITANMNYTGSTQLASAFSVNALKQDGLAAGKLTGINIDEMGVIFAKFSNGSSMPLGKVAMTQFANPQGLAKLGDSTWGQSSNSGSPIQGDAGSGNFGLIQSGALEQSNVDLSAQLVNLITAQQAYQANSQTISTENSVIQTILNIR